jgi:hypothetical protein
MKRLEAHRRWKLCKWNLYYRNKLVASMSERFFFDLTASHATGLYLLICLSANTACLNFSLSLRNTNPVSLSIKEIKPRHKIMELSYTYVYYTTGVTISRLVSLMRLVHDIGAACANCGYSCTEQCCYRAFAFINKNMALA